MAALEPDPEATIATIGRSPHAPHAPHAPQVPGNPPVRPTFEIDIAFDDADGAGLFVLFNQPIDLLYLTPDTAAQIADVIRRYLRRQPVTPVCDRFVCDRCNRVRAEFPPV